MLVKETELIDLSGWCFLVGLMGGEIKLSSIFSESISADKCFFSVTLLLMGEVFTSCTDMSLGILLRNAVFK